MGKPHPVELRSRIVDFVEEGHSHREAARHFRVSPRCVNEVMKLWRETGSVAPKRQGNGGGHGKLAGVRDWLAARIMAKPDLTLDDLAEELAEVHAITVHPVTIWRSLKDLDLTHKKSPARRRAAKA